MADASQARDAVHKTPDKMAHARLLSILTGSWIAQACFAIAELGVPDLLADGPLTADELAARSGADRTALRRILNALASAGLLRQSAPGSFALIATTEPLRSDSHSSVRSNALMYGNEVYRSFAEIMHTVRTGRPAFDQVYGMPFYAYLDEHPEIDWTFSAAQASLPVPAALSECDLSGAGTLADIGGGNGRLVGQVLTRYPTMRAILLERPEVIRQAADHLAGLGLLDRTELVAGDFFHVVPGGADVYVLSRCLHNWGDDNVIAILGAIRRAMAPGSRLIVLEEFLQDGPAMPGGAADKPGAGSGPGKLVDLLMLVMLEGHDRSEDDYRELLAKAGFEILAVRPAPGRRSESAIEARPGRAV